MRGSPAPEPRCNKEDGPRVGPSGMMEMNHEMEHDAARRENAGAGGNLGGELRRFLAAEVAEDDAAAERALGGLFAALPGSEPRADFAARVMARIEASPLRALPGALPRAARDLPPALRLPLAAALALAGVAAFYVVPALYLLFARLEPGSLLAAGAGLGSAFETRLAEWSWLPQLASQLFDALFDVLASPPVLLVLFLSAALATLLSRWLLILLGPARRSSDVAFR